MKKIYVFFCGLSLFVSGAVWAADCQWLTAEAIQEIKGANVNKFCTYKNELYGRGAIVEVGSKVMTCWPDRFSGELEWQEGTKAPR
ncbi:DUF1496 domain-containing protein [Escherichia coli]|uniref:DUF1496 domain-containing protein n=1 Tax=Escherichia coli TaxID=562 RepID=UPI000A19C632|nr:DUF1496 domain-containing protein [Escherichia coli]